MPSPARVRALLFDAGHTLLECDYAELTGYLRSRAHEVSQAAAAEAERRARMRLELDKQGSRGRTGEGRYVRFLLEALGIGNEEHGAVTEWRRRFNPPVGLCHRADPEAAKALGQARAAGLVVGVISNSNGSVQMALERVGLAAELDFVIDSSVVGVAKPDPRIFALGLSAAGTRAEEAVYVGDSYFADVVGARRAGLGAVLFDPGRLWGDRDCAVATGLCAAVDLVLNQSGGPAIQLFG